MHFYLSTNERNQPMVRGLNDIHKPEEDVWIATFANAEDARKFLEICKEAELKKREEKAKSINAEIEYINQRAIALRDQVKAQISTAENVTAPPPIG